MGDTAAGALITAIATLLAILLTYLLKRKPNKLTAYEQLSAELAALRKEFRDYKREQETEAKVVKREQDNENDYNRALIVHLDNEVIEIRQGVNSGAIPPLPPRPPYPLRRANQE